MQRERESKQNWKHAAERDLLIYSRWLSLRTLSMSTLEWSWRLKYANNFFLSKIFIFILYRYSLAAFVPTKYFPVVAWRNQDIAVPREGDLTNRLRAFVVHHDARISVRCRSVQVEAENLANLIANGQVALTHVEIHFNKPEFAFLDGERVDWSRAGTV